MHPLPLIALSFPCRGRYLVALGHAYHPEEFVCSQCGKVLEEGGFFEEKGAIFCPPCYDVRYAPSCAKCKKKITGVSGAGSWRGCWEGKPDSSALRSVEQLLGWGALPAGPCWNLTSLIIGLLY